MKNTTDWKIFYITILYFATMQLQANETELTNYNIIAVFFEPELQGGIGQDTTFSGSFTWNSNKKQITNLKGKMNSSMVSNDLKLNLNYQIEPSKSDGNGGIIATVFKNNTTKIFSNVNYTAIQAAVTDGTSNAFFTLDVNSLDPSKTTSNDTINTWCKNGAHLSSDICNIKYADCTDEGLMGPVCMTGHSLVGSMGAIPWKLTITKSMNTNTTDTTPIVTTPVVTPPVVITTSSIKPSTAPQSPACQIYTADRVFDGNELLEKSAILIKKNKIIRTGMPSVLKKLCSKVVNLGDATILPGFIESHAHLTYQVVNPDIVLKHGITTVLDAGGPLIKPVGGDGNLRLLSAGPIIQAPSGYPLNVFGGTSGYDQIGLEVSDIKEAENIVQSLVDNGAAMINIALEPGGETGAPWSMDHGYGTLPQPPWSLLSLDIVKAVVTKAHTLHKIVAAHIGENQGAKLALDGGVDEWAHTPCTQIDDDLLQQAVSQGVKVVSAIDTLGSCSGVTTNVMNLANKMQTSTTGSEFIYGSEIAHDNVPWGINGEELSLMLHLTGGTTIDFQKVVNVIKSATSNAGKNLGLEPLGTLAANAPADVIAVKGNPFERFKILEYPDLVISGGRVVVNNFK